MADTTGAVGVTARDAIDNRTVAAGRPPLTMGGKYAGIVGRQTPRLEWIPPAVSRVDAEDVIALAAVAGLDLDPWQQYVLRGALGTDAAGKWTAFEVALIVARQNGKGSILEALELAWLFLFDDRLILHSAHEFKTAQEAFIRVRGLVDAAPDLRRRVKRVNASHGEEGIELLDGTRLRFLARTKGSGRGFSADKIVFDEAYNLPDVMIDATLPTTGARTNPQVWYTSSAADRDIAPCDALARVRRRGIAGGDPSLAFFEWSVPFDDRTGKPTMDRRDPYTWAVANPSMNIRKPADRIETFCNAMSPEGFDREELGVGNYPEGEDGDGLIPGWTALADPAGTILGRPVFCVETTTKRDRTSVSVAGGRPDGRVQVERVEASDGTAWVVPWLVERARRYNAPVVVDPRGPAGVFINDLADAGVRVHEVTAEEWVTWCGRFVDACEADRVRHLGDQILGAAMKGVATKRARDSWAIDRVNSRGDITPFTAAVLAAGHHMTTSSADYNPLDSVGF